MNIDLILAIVFYGLLLLFYLKNKDKFEIQAKVLALYKTKLGLKLMDKFAKKFPTLLKYIGYIGVLFGFVRMVFILYYLISGTYRLLTIPNSIPVLAPVLPGVKIAGLPTLSFWYWIISILVIAVVHEFSHGVFSRLYGVKIKSSGFAFLGPLLAAFVEPDEKNLAKKSKLAQLSILAAGSFANILTACFVLLITILILNPAVSSIVEQKGIQVLALEENYPAYNAGLKEGDTVLFVNNFPVSTTEDFKNVLANLKPDDKVIIQTNNTIKNLIATKNPNNVSKGYLGISIAPLDLKVKDGIIKKYGNFIPLTILWIAKLFFWLFAINLGVALFNLLPLAIVDGGRMFTTGLSYFVKSKRKIYIIFRAITFLCLFLIFVNLLPYIIKLILFLINPLLVLLS